MAVAFILSCLSILFDWFCFLILFYLLRVLVLLIGFQNGSPHFSQLWPLILTIHRMGSCAVPDIDHLHIVIGHHRFADTLHSFAFQFVNVLACLGSLVSFSFVIASVLLNLNTSIRCAEPVLLVHTQRRWTVSLRVLSQVPVVVQDPMRVRRQILLSHCLHPFQLFKLFYACTIVYISFKASAN